MTYDNLDAYGLDHVPSALSKEERGRYLELSDEKDMGHQLTPAERAELSTLKKRMLAGIARAEAAGLY